MSSRPHVTITLGRSGRQVVRKGESATSLSNGRPSVRERLGFNLDTSGSRRNKRQRTEHSNRSLGDNHDKNNKDRQVGRYDLRLKLMSKSLSKRNSTVARQQHENVSQRTEVHSRSGTRGHAPKYVDSGRIPSRKNAVDLMQFDSSRPYSSWTLDGLRHRSPDRPLRSSRGTSPPRSYNELQHIPLTRSTGSLRATHSNDVGDASRPTTFTSKPGIHVEVEAPIPQAPPRGIMQKSSHMSELPPTVASLLDSLDLKKYAILFQAEEVDMSALKQMGDNDLKELGIPMGPRKKILLAVLSRSRHRRQMIL